MSDMPIALQLYTVRDLTAQDFAGTVRKVASLGYSAIETEWPFPIPRPELKALLEELGLRVVGAHVALPHLENDLPAALEENLAIGNPYIICPYLPEERRRDLRGWRNVAALFEQIGKTVHAAGLQFCYHNHNFEFETFGGKAALDHLYEWTDPTLVKAELDVYWVKYGGAEPLDYIRRLANRLPLVHLKDMDASDRSFAEVGEGIIDMQSVIREAQRSGTEWFVVEQDVCKRPSLESARISLANLRRLAW